MNINNILTACAKTLIAMVIAFAICALVLCFTSCSSKRTLTNTTSHVTDTTHITIFHDSVRVTLRDTTIINFRDSTIVHTKIIERFDPSTGNLTDRETDHYESLYHEYIDRSSRQIDSLRRAIDSALTNHYTADAEEHINETIKPTNPLIAFWISILTLVIFLCIIIYRHEHHK